jgi:hypothetical protein
MTNLARKGGIAASIILIILGVGALVAGVAGREKVQSDLAREQIVGTPDSTIPGQKVDTGGEAKAFAAVMRKHTLEATGGQTYAQMGRFLDKSGKPTGDENAAATDPKTGKPVENPARDIWISSTAFQTALNTAYFAESVATFVIAVGGEAKLVTGHAAIALAEPSVERDLLVCGFGFLVLTLRLLRADPAPARVVPSGATAAIAS